MWRLLRESVLLAVSHGHTVSYPCDPNGHVVDGDVNSDPSRHRQDPEDGRKQAVEKVPPTRWGPGVSHGRGPRARDQVAVGL
jgi:hypothetical protein